MKDIEIIFKGYTVEKMCNNPNNEKGIRLYSQGIVSDYSSLLEWAEKLK